MWGKITWMKIREILLGKPLATRAVGDERLTNAQGLAIFGSDALSSTAYATEEILLVLAAVGTSALFTSIPIALGIAFLILLVSLSYRQVIQVYPQGGGVYSVAHKNLGEFPALLGAAALIIDYVLTVTVSVAAGVAAITSAFPELLLYRVPICVGVIVLLKWANLRGVKESGKLFSIPTYLFVATMLGLIGYGVLRYLVGSYPNVQTTEALHAEGVGVFGLLLLLRAFAAGCTALTGIEATSNGVQAFRPPEAENAAKTLIRMACILGTIFVGLTLLAYWGGIQPSGNETVVSQIARSLFDRTPPYFLVQASTALILLLAANTPFAGFPRIASQLAVDGYFPRQFTNLGTRLVFANGIVFLAVQAIVLVYIFHGNVHALIPLYAVGVFLGFSISQFGMIRYWLSHPAKNKNGIVINAFGFVATLIVFGVVFFAKFLDGAWLLIPGVIFYMFLMKKIKKHYLSMEQMFSLDGPPIPEIEPEKTVVMLVPDVDRATLHALKFARSLQPVHFRALHVALDTAEGEKMQAEWQKHVPDVPLDVVVSDYRDLISPILQYLKDIDKKWKNDAIIVVILEFIPEKVWHFFLHNQTAMWLRMAIEQDPDINAEILDVPVKITTKLR